MPTTLYANARFRTMNPACPLAEAVAVRDGRVIGAGDLGPVKHLIGGPHREVDLDGRTVMPAFTDAHIHLASYCLRRSEVDLAGTASTHDATQLIAEKSAQLPPGSWVRGGGWDKNRWPGAGFPSAAEIDRVCPDRPVAVSSKDGHALWVNSLALEVAGIGPDSPQPEGGEIIMDQGAPTGVLLERAMELVYRVVPAPDAREVRQAIIEGQRSLHALGITAVHVPEGSLTLSVLRDLYGEEQLMLRVLMMIPAASAESAVQLGLGSGFGDDMLRLGPIKIFADGALGSQTAHMLSPYETRPDSWGIEVTTAAEMVQLVPALAADGFASAVHAIGDAATRAALDAFAAARTMPWLHRVEHAQLVSPDDLDRFARLKVTASMQPCHLLSDWDLIDMHWGSRGRTAFPFATLWRQGVNLAFGSDAPVEPVEPLSGLYAAVKRPCVPGAPERAWYPQERLEVSDAVRAYTLGPAVAEPGGPNRGMLKEGMWADMIVLADDIFQQPDSISDTRVMATYMAGEVVHEVC